jgi:hypothetical protein
MDVGAFSPTKRPDAREIVSMWVEPKMRGGKLADQLLSTAMGPALLRPVRLRADRVTPAAAGAAGVDAFEYLLTL